jgi:hypothetical protein
MSGKDENETPPQAIIDQVKLAINDDSLPQIYFNGFSIATTSGDAILVLKLNEKPIAVLNTSYTLAKTLLVKMGGVLTKYESSTQETILTTDEVQERLEAGDKT